MSSGNKFHSVKILAIDMLHSSEELLAATKLTSGDEIKQNMIAHLAADFNAIRAREQALTLLVKRKDYDLTFLAEEFIAISQMNRRLVSKIREKLLPLSSEKAELS